MNRVLLIVMAIALLLIGPAMFLFARTHALDVALSRIRPGQTSAQVVAVLGRPQRRLSPSPALAGPPSQRPLPAKTSPGVGADLEYRYTVWPLPGTWVVDFKDGRVVGTSRQ